MSTPLLHFLDWFFLIFHALLVIFNVLGWAWSRTRKLNLICLSLTAASWLLMGIWYGVGYCICTDWHWQVRRQLGYQDESATYIQFLVERTFGIVPDVTLTKNVSAAIFVLAFSASVYFNLRDRRQAKLTNSAIA